MVQDTQNETAEGGRGGLLNCSELYCRLSNCWPSCHSGALIVRVPSGVMASLGAPERKFPIIQYKRDFEITAAVVAASAAAAVAATAAGFTMVQSIQNAATINQFSERVAGALQIQETLNGQLHFDIMTLNQQTALLQEQLDALYLQQRPSCDLHYHAICVTPAIVKNASAEVRELNVYLAGP